MAPKTPKKKSSEALELPPGLRHTCTLSGHGEPVSSIAWSTDGELLACGTEDKAIHLWKKNGERLRTLRGHNNKVQSLAWSEDGALLASYSTDKTVRHWDVQSGKQLRQYKGIGNPVFGVAWSPDCRIFASAFSEQSIRISDVRTDKLKHLKQLDGHTATVLNVAWSPNGRLIASSAADGTIRIWDTDTQRGELLRVFDRASEKAYCMAWASDNRTLASSSSGNAICIWDTESGRQLAVLEGNTSTLQSLRFGCEGRLLVSQSTKGVVQFWRCDTWEPVALLDKRSSPNGGLDFNPQTALLAIASKEEVQLCELDDDTLLGAPPEPTARHYRNAKVVLVGDTGVGKSGLRMVLSQEGFRPTLSTHGRKVGPLESQETDLPDGRREMRELLLWDLAGQPGYRLIHQLHLNEVSVALVVFDARSETEPFGGVRHWDRALRQAQRLQGATSPLKKFLVAARCDRGGISVSRERLEATLRDLNFDGFFETSAKEGTQIRELGEAIRNAITWEHLPSVSSNDLFQTIKRFLVDEKEARRLLSTADDLYRAFCRAHPRLADDPELRAKFHTCIGRVENRDLIRRLKFGGYILLQPEVLDTYASSLINAAKSEPDGLGFIAEEDALQGRFAIPLEERIVDKDLEKLLLIATIEELLRHELALRETTDAGVDLVFPSQLTREAPDAPDAPGRATLIVFEGALLNIYATLVVRLSHSQLFKKKEMWKNAAAFEADVGGSCGIHLRELEEGKGELTLFFDAKASKTTRYQFESYISAHLGRRALPHSIRRRRIFVCSSCGEPITDGQRTARLNRGWSFMACPVCETRIELLDSQEPSSLPTPSVVHTMDDNADEQRKRNTAEAIIRGKREAKDYDVFLCHHSNDKPAVKEIGQKLLQQAILPWLDEWELRPGTPWQRALEEQIEKVKAVAVFVGETGLGPWQDLEQSAFLQQFVQRGCPVIPVMLTSCEQFPKLPVFLRGMGWVDFRKKEPNPLEQLLWGITGKRHHL
jgi:GTPase SAR1 family protein